MAVFCRSGVATFVFLALVGCTEHDRNEVVFGRPSFQLPGENVAHATDSNQRGEISLVSLVFPRLEGVEGVIATNRLTGKLIGNHLVETDEWMVVTLELFRGEIQSPHLLFLGTKEKTFKADIQPQHNLETYQGLAFDRPTVVLRDLGVERQLKVGEVAEVPPEELVTLWLGDRFGTAARAHFQNSGDPGLFFLWSQEGNQAWTLQRGRLQSTSSTSEVGLGSDECLGIIVAPTYTLTDVVLVLERRD